MWTFLFFGLTNVVQGLLKQHFHKWVIPSKPAQLSLIAYYISLATQYSTQKSDTDVLSDRKLIIIDQLDLLYTSHTCLVIGPVSPVCKCQCWLVNTKLFRNQSDPTFLRPLNGIGHPLLDGSNDYTLLITDLVIRCINQQTCNFITSSLSRISPCYLWVSWPSGLVHCGFESQPGRSRRLCPWARHLTIIASSFGWDVKL